MGVRLSGFDYTRPYYYMVTLRRLDGLAAFSAIDATGVVENAITRAFHAVIKNFHLQWHVVEPIWCYVIMPDHIHLLIKLAAGEKRLALGTVVHQLMRALARVYAAQTEQGGAKQGARTGQGSAKQGAQTEQGGAKQGAQTGQGGAKQGAQTWQGGAKQGAQTGQGSAKQGAQTGQGGAKQGAQTEQGGAKQGPGGAGQGGGATGACGASGRSVAPIFSRDWHDWIVKRDGQLDAFITYIRENPARSWLRRNHRAYFQRVNEIDFLGRKWYGYGNAALLNLPVLEPFRCSRKWVENGPEWSEAVARASRLGPGGAGVSTFMSPCEKACGHALGLAGGRWIVLSPEGFGERWHPGRQYEKFCAEGRMLFISLWPAMAREPSFTSAATKWATLLLRG